jgi:two-component system, sensor histidine kinase and response regulator
MHVSQSALGEQANTSPAVLDPAALEQIRALSMAGAPSLLEKIINIYLSDSQSLVDRLNAALNADEPDVARQSAHALASSSGNLGALGLASLCRQIETASSVVEQRRLGIELTQEHVRVLQALRRVLVAA